MYSNLQTPKRDFNDSLKRLELPQKNKKRGLTFFRELHSKAIKTCVRRSKKPLFVDNYQRKGGHTGFFLSWKKYMCVCICKKVGENLEAKRNIEHIRRGLLWCFSVVNANWTLTQWYWKISPHTHIFKEVKVFWGNKFAVAQNMPQMSFFPIKCVLHTSVF